MELTRTCCQPKLCSSLLPLFHSFSGLLVSSRSKFTTCPRKRLRLVRFQLNSTATSGCGAQKLRNNICMILNLLQPKLQPNLSQLKCHDIKPCRDLHRRASIFNSIFFNNLLLTMIIFCVTDQTFITWSRRSVLKCKFSVFTHLRFMSCSWALSYKCAEWKYSTPT